MARIYIKDLIKSVLKMDVDTTSKNSKSQDSLSPNSDSDEYVPDDNSTSMGLLSPNGPMRGRSVKEFEEQLTTLRKENFNLKLRIYFLEEKMGTNFSLDKENALKQNIELLVEVESLRKEIQEKQELLCQAVKAMELEEEEHKKDSDLRENQLLKLQSDLEESRQKYEAVQEGITSRQQLDDQRDIFVQTFDIPLQQNLDVVNDIQVKIEELHNKLETEKESNAELSKCLKLADIKCQNCESIEKKVIQKDLKLESLISDLETKEKLLLNYTSSLKQLEEELHIKQCELDVKDQQLQRKDSDLKLRNTEVEELNKLIQKTRNLYETEYHKVEKHKTAIQQQNNKMLDLETSSEKLKQRVIYLEAMLEQSQTEVKRAEELQTIRSPVRRQKSTITDVDSFLVPSPSVNSEGIHKKTPVGSPSKTPKCSGNSSISTTKSRAKGSLINDERAVVLYQKNEDKSTDLKKNIELLERNLDKSKRQITKLEKDQVRACKIIQSMLDARKEHLKQIGDMELKLQMKDKEVLELKEHVNQTNFSNEERSKSLQSKISELNLTVSTNPPKDTEVQTKRKNRNFNVAKIKPVSSGK